MKLNYIISGFLTFAILYIGLRNNQFENKVTNIDISGTWWHYSSNIFKNPPIGFDRKFHIENNVIYQITPKDTYPQFGIYAHRFGSSDEIKLSLFQNWMDFDECYIGGLPSEYALTDYSIAEISNQIMVIKKTYFKFKEKIDSIKHVEHNAKLRNLIFHYQLDTFYNCKFRKPPKDLYRPSDTAYFEFM